MTNNIIDPMRENATNISETIREFVEENARTSHPFTLLPLEGKRPFLSDWTKIEAVPSEAWESPRIDSVGVRTGNTARGVLLCIDIDTKDRKTFETVTNAMIGAGFANNYIFPAGSVYGETTANGSHLFLLTEPAPFGVPEYRKHKLMKDAAHSKGPSGYTVELIAEGGQVRIYPSTERDPKEGGTLLNLRVQTPRPVIDAFLNDLKKRSPEPMEPHEDWKDSEPAPALSLPSSPSSCAPTYSSDAPAQYLRNYPETLGRFLEAHGWREVAGDATRWGYQRPDTSDKSRANHSIRVAKDGGAVSVWSSCLNSEQGATVSPLSFVASEFYGGNEREAARDLIRLGYCPAPVPSSCDSGGGFSEFDAYEEAAEPAPVVDFTTIEEKTAAIKAAASDEGAGLFSNIEGAISYGCAHMEELESKLPEELYKSSDTIRRLIDSISPEDTPARVGYFAAAWTLCGFLLGGSVYEEHYTDGAEQNCSTSQFTFLFAPSGSGKNTCKRFIQSCCKRYNGPAVDRVKAAQMNAEKKHAEAVAQWEAAPKDSRGPRPSLERPDGFPRACISQPVSAPALVSDWVRTDGKMMICVDEARDYLKAMTAKDARNYCAEILTLFREAYTAERGTYSAETSQTSRRDGGAICEEIENPCLNAFYCGVPPTDWAALAHCAEDGTFGRFNFFFFRPRPDREIKISINRPASEGKYIEFRKRLINRWANIAADNAGEPDAEKRGQCITWTEEAAELLGRYTMEANQCAAHWANRAPAFAAVVGHSPLRYVKAALIYTILDYQGEGIRTAKINAEACKKAYRFILYQFAQLMHVYNLRGGSDLGPLVKRLAAYAADVSDARGWFTVNAVYAAGFRGDGWPRRAYPKKLKELEDLGEPIQWNKIRGRGCAFRITAEDETETGE